MSYRLAVHKRGHKTINLKGYSSLSENMEMNEESLKDIVNFTNEFNNHEELMEALIYLGQIAPEYTDGKLGIRQIPQNGEARILEYGLSFKKDSNFFDFNLTTDLKKLQNFYNSQITNIEFMRPFVERNIPIIEDLKRKYPNNFETYDRLQWDLTCIKESLQKLEDTNKLDDYEIESMEYLIYHFIENYCKYQIKGQEYCNEYGLRDLAMFAINYQRRTRTNDLTIENTMDENTKKQKDILEAQITHHLEICKTKNISQEEFDAHMDAIASLQEQIDSLAKKQSRSRSNENDSTED